MTPTRRRQSKKPPNIENFISKGSPDFYFILQEHLQQRGVILIDLETSTQILGQVVFPEIGLIHPSRKPTQKRHLGFMPPRDTPKQNDYSNTNIDAILNFQNEITESGIPLVLISTIDANDVDIWADLALEVGLDMSVETEAESVPTIHIAVAGMSRPDKNDPKSTIRTILRRYQNHGQESSSFPMSDLVYPQDDCGDDDYDY